jgi:drug/metabolite transporter (DMT)-like permease
MGRTSGYVDGLLSGATWGVVAVLLPGTEQLAGASLPATATAVAALFDAAAALFLLAVSGVAGSLADVGRVLVSRRVFAVGTCSLLGGPLFMGGYIVAVMLAGPADALTATATYPVVGALLAWPLLRQRLTRSGWAGVAVVAVGAALIAVDAGAAAGRGHVLAGTAVALVAATAVAGEGIVATWAMAGLDTTTVMAVRELLSAAMFGLLLLAVPGATAAVGTVIADSGLVLPIVGAGMVGGYSYAVWYRSIRRIGVAPAMALNISYAMWGALFAWSLRQTPMTLLAVGGCVGVTAGAVVTILSGGHEPTDRARLRPGRHSTPSSSVLIGCDEGQQLVDELGVGDQQAEARAAERGVVEGDHSAARLADQQRGAVQIAAVAAAAHGAHDPPVRDRDDLRR